MTTRNQPPNVCVSCGLPFSPQLGENGVEVIEMRLMDENVRVPYRIWQGDVHKCPGCGHEIVPATTYGMIPIMKDDIEEMQKRIDAIAAGNKQLENDLEHKEFMIRQIFVNT